MQTFLPYSDFRKSAKVLDRLRLGKQRVETYQILLTLKNGGRWSNHPAVKMWHGYENSLIEYGMTMCDEWLRRGYRDTVRQKLWNMYPWHQPAPKPWWLGNPEFHRSHRSNLLRKDENHYSKYWKGPIDLPYFWPTQHYNTE